MKVRHINLAQTFTNSKKSKFKFNNKMGTNITVSKSNQNGRWFYSKCDDPSYRVFVDEIKQEIVKKPKIEYEYFNIKRNENGEDVFTPVDGEIIMQDGKVKVICGDVAYDFSGVSYKKQNGELVEEVRHKKGYPFQVTEYRDGEEYKYTHYSQNSHKINGVYFFDGSFELLKKIAPQSSSAILELQTINKYGEKVAISFNAPNTDSIGSAKCEIPTGDGYKNIALNWTYPVVEYSFSGDTKEAQTLQHALIQLAKVIKSNTYKDDFGTIAYLNRQLQDAIDYLEDIKTNQYNI